MSILRRFALAVLLLTAIASNAAAESGPQWACWYDSVELKIQCLLARAPQSGREARAVEVATTIDRRLPKLVETIWGSPETLAHQQISIPLYAPPLEMDFVAELAIAVMCGTRRDCTASLDPNVDGHAPVRVAALCSGEDPSEILAELTRQGVLLTPAESSLPVAAAPSNEEPRRRRRRG